ncbi:Rieske (2Fe-2S) protein [Scytonema millei]|nr:Rieske 2Fe-2S domain-containing protein [Scytonema millei]
MLAHRSMLKPNLPMKVSLYGKDYVLWQDSTGNISCLPNACPHMGAMLSAGWCVKKSDGSSAIACPFKQFIDNGLHSHAYIAQVRKKPNLQDFLKNPGLLAMPQVLEAHLENFFPFMGMVHGESPLLSLKECHFYLPESETHSRVYVLMFVKANHPIAHAIKRNLLRLVEVVTEQDAYTLSKIYVNTPQHIKLNNEVGMDWVRRNYASFPAIVEPNFSRSQYAR